MRDGSVRLRASVEIHRRAALKAVRIPPIEILIVARVARMAEIALCLTEPVPRALGHRPSVAR